MLHHWQCRGHGLNEEDDNGDGQWCATSTLGSGWLVGTVGEMRGFRQVAQPFIDFGGEFRVEMIRTMGQVIRPTKFLTEYNP